MFNQYKQDLEAVLLIQCQLNRKFIEWLKTHGERISKLERKVNYLSRKLNEKCWK